MNWELPEAKKMLREKSQEAWDSLTEEQRARFLRRFGADAASFHTHDTHRLSFTMGYLCGMRNEDQENPIGF